MELEKASRDGRAGKLGTRTKAFEQVGNGLQRPFEHGPARGRYFEVCR